MGFLKTFEQYSTFADFSSDFLTKFKDNCPEAVSLKHRIYGNGTITEMIPVLSKDLDVKTTIAFESETKIFYFCRAVKNNGFVGISEQTVMLLNEYSRLCGMFYDAQREAELAERQKLAEEKKAEEEAAKQAKKEQQITNRFNKEYEKLSTMQQLTFTKVNEANDFYYALGWLTANGHTLSAAMPDFMENWFVSTFGNVKHSVVDSKKRTSGGFPMQWTLSMKLAIKNVDRIPVFLEKYLSADKKFIANTEFLYTLVQDNAFAFGTKNQNLEQVRATVPANFITLFDRGAAII